LGGLKQEHFVVVLLNSAGYVIRDYTVFVGTLDSAGKNHNTFNI